MAQEPNDIQRAKARRFLKDLAEAPFMAIVFEEDGETRLYTKGISEEELRTIKLMLGLDEEE